MKTEIEKILVLENYSSPQHIAVGQAAVLGERMNAAIVVAGVDRIYAPEKAGKGEPADALKKEEKKKLLQELKDVKSKVFDELIRKREDVPGFISKEKPSLIVFNAEPVKKVRNSFIEDILDRAECPVLAMKKGGVIENLETIILPLDLSTETTDKVNDAVTLAQLFNTTIHVISILKDPDDFVTNKLNKQLEMVQDFILSKVVKCTTELIRVINPGSSLAQSILDHAHKQEADLIMIMARDVMEKEKDQKVSEEGMEIIEGSEVPVLCVPPSPKERISFT